MPISRRELIRTGGAVVGGAALTGAGEADAATPLRWTHEADLIVIGSGASGMVCAIAACEAGCSVIVLEAEPDIGGHAICSGANVPLGGGTSAQVKHGIKDSADLVFRDLTDWSVIEPNGSADYRYNDREVIRAFADHSAATYEFLVAHGVIFLDQAPDVRGGMSVGASVPRVMHARVMNWPRVETGVPTPLAQQVTEVGGVGIMRPLEAAARKAGVDIRLEHRMTALHRDGAHGPVVGVAATHKGQAIHFRAKKAVYLGTGGSTGNVEFRRMFDPRLTEEYCGLAGAPWSDQDASGELAAMAIGASLGGLANYASENGWTLTKAGRIGCRYGYRNLAWAPGSRVWDRAKAIGLQVGNWQNAILVNMLGKRFYDETGDQYGGNSPASQTDYVQDSWRNAANKAFKPNNFLNAALAGIGDGHNGGGPIWAIFDAEGVRREKWDPAPPNVDPDGFFFTAPTLAELAARIVMPYQRRPMTAEALEATVARYNGFVDAGADADFGKPKPLYKIATGPFYAAWSTPVVHDTRGGLRINGKGQVIDMKGAVIPGLYCGGESAGGFNQHGLARATCQGYIAGRHAAGVEA